jgi:hypothetical protein
MEEEQLPSDFPSVHTAGQATFFPTIYLYVQYYDIAPSKLDSMYSGLHILQRLTYSCYAATDGRGCVTRSSPILHPLQTRTL